VYSDYGNAVKNAYIASMRIASNSNRTTAKEIADYQQALSGLERATLERTAKWESVLLLGNPDTVAAARAWHRSVWKLQDIAHGAPISDSEKQALTSEFEGARLQFYEAARKDLGITSGQLPRGELWEWDRSDQ